MCINNACIYVLHMILDKYKIIRFLEILSNNIVFTPSSFSFFCIDHVFIPAQYFLYPAVSLSSAHPSLCIFPIPMVSLCLIATKDMKLKTTDEKAYATWNKLLKLNIRKLKLHFCGES